MSSLPTEIEKQEGGTVLVRADLHIHSFGNEGFYDASDTALTPQGIVDSAIATGVKVIAIADHHRGGRIVELPKPSEEDLRVLVEYFELLIEIDSRGDQIAVEEYNHPYGTEAKS